MLTYIEIEKKNPNKISKYILRENKNGSISVFGIPEMSRVQDFDSIEEFENSFVKIFRGKIIKKEKYETTIEDFEKTNPDCITYTENQLKLHGEKMGKIK